MPPSQPKVEVLPMKNRKNDGKRESKVRDTQIKRERRNKHRAQGR